MEGKIRKGREGKRVERSREREVGAREGKGKEGGRGEYIVKGKVRIRVL